MANQIDTQEFIRRATQKHGTTYDYSQVNYTHNKTCSWSLNA